MKQFDLSDLIIYEVTSVSSIFSDTNKTGKRVNRERWAIIHKYEGETVYLSEGKKYISNSQSVMLLPKDCSYEWECIKAGHFYSLEFDANLSLEHPLIFSNINNEAFLKTFRRMETLNILKEKNYKIENLRDTYSIITKLLKTNVKKYSPSDKRLKIEPAVKYIAENITETPKNDRLAELCGISTVYFRKLFTEIYGDSPINYIHHLKIEKSKEMLNSDYGSISEIALTLGYRNVYDFSRDFKKHIGISPKIYLARHKNATV